MEISTHDRSPLSGHKWSLILSLETLNTLIPVSRQYASNRIICRWLAESISVSTGTRQVVPWMLSHCLDASARSVGSMPHVIVLFGHLASFCSVHDSFALSVTVAGEYDCRLWQRVISVSICCWLVCDCLAGAPRLHTPLNVGIFSALTASLSHEIRTPLSSPGPLIPLIH